MSFSILYRGLSVFILAVFISVILYYCIRALMSTIKERNIKQLDLHPSNSPKSKTDYRPWQERLAESVSVKAEALHCEKTDVVCDSAQCMLSFFQSKNPGKYFVELIALGILCTLMCGNHSFNFPDQKQHEDFRRYAGEELSSVLDEIGKIV